MNNLRRMKNYSIIILIMIVIGVSLIIIGITYPIDFSEELEPTSSISFAITGDAEQRKIIAESIKYFENENNCKVEIYNFSSIEALEDRLLAQYSIGEPFDVFYISPKTLDDLKYEIVALDEVMEMSKETGDVFIEAALKSGQIASTQYAIPTGVRPYCIFYNINKLNEYEVDLPQSYMNMKMWSIDDFVEYCSMVYEKSKSPVFAISPEWQSLYSIILSGGGSIEGISDDSRLILDEEGLYSLRKLEYLIDLGAVVSTEYIQYGADSLSLFRSESVPMIAGSIEYIYDLYELVDFTWDITPMPMVSGNYETTVIDVLQIAVSNGRNVELSKNFVQYFVSSFGQKMRLEEGEETLSSLNMAFYTSFGEVTFPDHSNYLFFIAENGKFQPIELYERKNNVVIDRYKKFIDNELELADLIYIEKEEQENEN